MTSPLQRAAVVLAGTLPLAAMAVDGGWYEPAQAARGGRLYALHCAACHGAHLDGGSAPPLTGPGFATRWDGLSVDDLFHVIQAQMPWDRPGTLAPGDGLDLTAFVLSVNGHPPGDAPLPVDAARRGRLVLGR